MYQIFFGIDIAKHSFVVASNLNNSTQSFNNNQQGFLQFLQKYQPNPKQTLINLETTGGYEIKLIQFLQQHQLHVHRANTQKVKHFIRSFGTLGKSDVIDAKALALYAQKRANSLPLFQMPLNKTLLKLVQRRNDLKHILVQEKNRLQAPDQQLIQQSCSNIINAILNEIENIEQQINLYTQQQPKLISQKQCLTSIPGIGNITAINLLALMPELGKLNRKQVASLAGLAPHPNESGRYQGHRFTRGGRKDVKTTLFMAAMAAARSHSALGDFYRRLLKAGKKKMVALTALMRKIIVIANARMKEWWLQQP